MCALPSLPRWISYLKANWPGKKLLFCLLTTSLCLRGTEPHWAVSTPALNWLNLTDQSLTDSGLSGQVHFLAVCEILPCPHSLCSWVISTWPHPMGRRVSQWIFSNLLSLESMCLSICTRDSGTDGAGAGPGVRSKSAPLLPSPGWGGHQRPPTQGRHHPCHKCCWDGWWLFPWDGLCWYQDPWASQLYLLSHGPIVKLGELEGVRII